MHAQCCNMLVSQLIELNFVDNSGLCTYCHVPIPLHSQVLPASSPLISSSNSSNSSKLDKYLIQSLPKWKKQYKLCTPFFSALELQFSIHNVTDESLQKRYLQLALSELPDYQQQYAHTHITNKLIIYHGPK